MVLEEEMIERMSICSIDMPRVITWEEMKRAAEDDPVYSKLMLALESNGVWLEEAKAFCHHRKEL